MDPENYNENILILRIELINFMCHDHLLLNFSKPFTCIGGSNGSGKSAIMIALGVLFGQRSSNLERGSSYKNLIKTDAQEFVIKCVINNVKNYNYDFFGDFIFIEKKVNKNFSALTISNKQKKVFSHKMEDLEFLLDFYSIRIDNPLNFLTQEQSKKFLNSRDPSQLYKFFLKGTEIADIKLINEKYEENVIKLKNVIGNIEDHIEKINEKLDKENKIMSALTNLDTLKNTIIQNENELKWSEIEDLKKQVDVVEEQINYLDKDIEKEKREHTDLMQEIEDLKLQKDNLIKLTQTMREDNKIKMTQIDDTISNTNKKIRNIENDLKSFKESYLLKKDLIRRLDKLSTVEDEKEALNKKKSEIEIQLEKLRVEQNEVNNFYEIERNKNEEKNKQINEFKKKFYYLQKQIEFCNKSESSNFIHPGISNIIKCIKETSFKEKVVGPICDYISLKEQKWSKVASLVLNKLLSSFICFNSEDRNKLSQIFKKFNVNFSILVPSNKTDSLIKYRRNDKCKVLLDVLDCKSNIVLNQLILMANIEEKALIENRIDAYKFIRSDPQYVDCAYTLNGDIIKKLGGSISDFAPRKMEKYFFEKSRDKLKNYQLELDLLIKNKPSTEESLEYKNIKKRYDFVLQRVNKYERLLADIIRQIESAEEIGLDNNEVMNNEELSESVRVLEKQITSLNMRIEKFRNNIKMLESDKDTILNTQYPSRTNLETNLQQLRFKSDISNGNLQQFIQKKSGLSLVYKEKMNIYKEARTNLLKDIPEISNPRNKSIILDEISRCKIEIEQTKKIGDKKETQDKINECLEKKYYYEEVLSCNNKIVEEVIKSFERRVLKREELKESIGKLASNRFKEFTLQRGYKGTLIFDHINEKLDLKMEVHNYGISGTKETLSGGERSFAAMSLLFSLWPNIICPIKILDEFDVFMDDLNRKYIIKKFIEYFKNSKNQVILITPLDTRDLINKDIDLQILKPPRS